ncbi:MAG: class I SAM-dependent methyltransferase [bacterium]|nr:class I SAM-dependent methyltransferase [bacterium]
MNDKRTGNQSDAGKKISRTARAWSKKQNPPMIQAWEIDLLIKYSKKCRVHFLEIGTYQGGSGALISRYLAKEVRLTTIDVFDDVPRSTIPPDSGPADYQEARRTIVRQGDIRKVRIIKGVSWEVPKKRGKRIDVLFVDGDHRYPSVKKDIASWEPYLVKGGYILLHDIDFPGVFKAFRDMLRDKKKFVFIERAGTLAVIRKRA